MAERWCARGVGVLLALALAAAAAGAAPAPALAELRNGLGLQDYQLSYLDARGQVLDEVGFAKALAAGSSFALSKDSATRSATLRLVDAAASAAWPGPKLTVELGQRLPDLRGIGPDGRAMRLRMASGHLQLLNFYFADCPPCIQEIPALNALQEAGEVRVVGVSFDAPTTTAALVKRQGIAFQTLSGAKAGIDSLGIKGYPTHLLVGPDGRLLATRAGVAVGDNAQLLRELQAWIAAARAAR